MQLVEYAIGALGLHFCPSDCIAFLLSMIKFSQNKIRILN